MRLRSLVPLVLTALCLISSASLMGAGVASASSSVESSASVVIEGFSTISFDQAHSRFFANFIASQPSRAFVNINDGTHFFNATFGTGGALPLAAGDYLHTSPSGLSQPELRVTETGTLGCGDPTGRFRIIDLATDGSGNISRLWMVFDQVCGGEPRLSGEVRFQEPGDGGTAIVSPRTVWWPDLETDDAPLQRSVTVWNPSASSLTLGADSISGKSASAFTPMSDGCSGATLGAGGSCVIVFKYGPSLAGEYSATLNIPEAGGFTHEVSFEGMVWAGKTVFQASAFDGLPNGNIDTFSYVPAHAKFGIFGDASNLEVFVMGSDNIGWSVFLSPPDGQSLATGQTYTRVARWPSIGSGKAGIMVQGAVPTEVNGCSTFTGSFTITDLYIDAYGEVQRLGLRFEEHCGQKVAASVEGTLAFRQNEVTATPSRSSIRVSGVISPNRPGETVGVQLQVKRSGAFRKVATRSATLNSSSAFTTTFARPSAKTCRVVASFPATAGQASTTFHC